MYFLKTFHCVSDKQVSHTHTHQLTDTHNSIQAVALFAHAVRSAALSLLYCNSNKKKNKITRDKALFSIASRKSYWDILDLQNLQLQRFDFRNRFRFLFCLWVLSFAVITLLISFNQVSFIYLLIFLYYLLINGMVSHSQYLIAPGVLILQYAECCLSVF